MGPATELAGSRFISKRKTLRGVKERFSIVGNRAILTLTKEKDEPEGEVAHPSGSVLGKSRKGEPNSNERGLNSTPSPGIKLVPSEKTLSELQSPAVPELETMKGQISQRYLKSRESAMNHMIYYLNQSNEGNGGKEGLKRIDLSKVKPQLISSEEVLTSNPRKQQNSPKTKLVEYASHELSQLEKRAIHPTKLTGSFSDQTDDENPYLAAAIPGKDIDILEVKNLNKDQILEILEMTREEKRSHQHRIDHLEKRTEALEKIIVAESEHGTDASHLVASFRGKLRDLLQQSESFKEQIRKIGELEGIAASKSDYQVLKTIKEKSKHIMQCLDEITSVVPENLKPIGKGKDVSLFELCPLQLRIPCAVMLHIYEISPYVRFPPKTTLGRLQEKYSILTLGRSSTATGHFGPEVLKSPNLDRTQTGTLTSINSMQPMPNSPRKVSKFGSGRKLPLLNIKRSYGPGHETQGDDWVPKFVRYSPRAEHEHQSPYTPKGIQPSSSGFMAGIDTGSQNEEGDKGRRDTLNSKNSGQGMSFGGSFRRPGGSEINQLDDPELNHLWSGTYGGNLVPVIGLETIQEHANRSGRGSGSSQDASRQFQDMKAEIAVKKEAYAKRTAELFIQNREISSQNKTKTRISLGPRANGNSLKRPGNQFESRGSQRDDASDFKRTTAARLFAVGRQSPKRLDSSFEDKLPGQHQQILNVPHNQHTRDQDSKRAAKRGGQHPQNANGTVRDSIEDPTRLRVVAQAPTMSILEGFRRKQTEELNSHDGGSPHSDKMYGIQAGSTTSSDPTHPAKHSIAYTSLDQHEEEFMLLPRNKSFEPPPVYNPTQSLLSASKGEAGPHFYSQTDSASSEVRAARHKKNFKPSNKRDTREGKERSLSEQGPTNTAELLQLVLGKKGKTKPTQKAKKLKYKAEEQHSPYIG